MSLCASGIRVSADAPAPRLERFYIGTYSGAIYQSTLSLGTGSFGAASRAASIGNPSFVALTPDRSFLYAVNEGAGMVGAFSVNLTNGVLQLLNQRSSNGGAPAHVVVDNSGRNVIVANYNGGSVTVFPILTNGQLGVATAHVQHPGPARWRTAPRWTQATISRLSVTRAWTRSGLTSSIPPLAPLSPTRRRSFPWRKARAPGT